MLAQRVVELPSVALEASNPTPSIELATAVLPSARLVLSGGVEFVVAVAVLLFADRLPAASTAFTV
ncbi:hypothetical protein D3C76_770740 [compost metagenome]